MPDVSDVREIIPARAVRVAPLAAPSPCPIPPPLARRTAYSSWLLRDATWHYLTLLHKTPDDTFRKPPATIWCLFLSAIQRSTSRFAVSLRHQTASLVYQGVPRLPQKAPVGCQSGAKHRPTCGTSRPSFPAPQRVPEGGRYWPLSVDLDTLFEEYFDDSNGQGRELCRRRKAPPPTCDRRNWPTSCASRPELCVGGVQQGVDRRSSGRAGLCGTPSTASILGLAQVADSLARECRRGGTPCQGRPPRQLEMRRGIAPLDPLIARTTPLREVPVPLPTVTPTGPQPATTPGMIFSTSRLISARPVIR